MDNGLNEFERKARVRLQTELSRMAVPQVRPRRRFNPFAGWSMRLAGGTALVAAVALIGIIMFRSIYTPPTQPGQAQGERVYLISKLGNEANRIRAMDSATQQIVWTVDLSHTVSYTESFPRFSEVGDMDELGFIQMAQQDLIDANRTPLGTVLSPDGSRLYLADHSGISALDTRDGKELWHAAANRPDSELSLAVSPDGQTLYVKKHWLMIGKDNNLVKQDWIEQHLAADGSFVKEITLPERIPFASAQTLFSRDGQSVYLIWTDYDAANGGDPVGKIDLINRDTGVMIGTTEGPFNHDALSESPDGRTLYQVATEGMGEDIRQHQLSIFNNPQSFIAPSGSAASPSGGRIQHLSTGDWSESLRISPRGDRLLLQVIDYPDHRLLSEGNPGPPSHGWWIYDPTTWQRVNVITPTLATTETSLQIGTLEFDHGGTNFYTVMDSSLRIEKFEDISNSGLWKDTLVKINSTDGTTQPLLELPGENVVRLLVSPAPSTVPDR